MFSLSELLNYDGFVVQCHDDPDADAIASAFAVFTYLKKHKKEARIVYSGRSEISKPNLLEMVVRLSVPLEYVREMPHIKTLILVDCQYGEKNVKRFAADTVVVLDHHVEKKTDNAAIGLISSQLGSCSTLICDLLKKEDFDFTKNPHVSTALYYGLYTDTNSLEEIAHPLDRDARDSLKFDPQILKILKNNNLSLLELNIAGAALMQHSIDHELGYAVFRSDPCDPNILGFISDLALQVKGIDVCIVYNTLNDGFKLSVRSCTREVMADEFIKFLTRDAGDGGGHKTKSGGFINKTYLDECGLNIEVFLEKRTQEYFKSYNLIDASSHHLNTKKMGRFKKKKIPVAYVLSTDIYKEGTPILIRTQEGDSEAETSEETFLMIGVLGEVYLISDEKFRRTYLPVSDRFDDSEFIYSPTVKNKITGDSVEIIELAKPCVAAGETFIFAAALEQNTKLFNNWYPDAYMFGRPGDMIAVRADDRKDVYIITKDVFEKTYEPLT